jgi:hypothetical protein
MLGSDRHGDLGMAEAWSCGGSGGARPQRVRSGGVVLYKEGERLCRELGNKDGLSGSLGNQGTILRAHGDLAGAMALHKEGEGLCRELGNKAGLSISLGNQGTILFAQGDLAGAMALHKKEERLCRELSDASGLAGSLADQALVSLEQSTVLSAQGKGREALVLLGKAIALDIEGVLWALAQKVKPIMQRLRTLGE